MVNSWWIIEKLREEEQRKIEEERPRLELPLYNPEDSYETTPEAPKSERGVFIIDL